MGEWFESWFNTRYYHLLYAHRDEAEARDFIHVLTDRLSLDQGAQLLDLACGDGRHCRTMHDLGYSVTGLDLASRNIEVAKRKSDPAIRFETADMRHFQLDQTYDAIFNLFTSFGYFESRNDNTLVLSNIRKHLHPTGTFVMDFMNARKSALELVAEETKIIDDVEFHIKRQVNENHFYKTIDVVDGNAEFRFEERVQNLGPKELQHMLEECGFKVQNVFGDYSLGAFNESDSTRLILVAQPV